MKFLDMYNGKLVYDKEQFAYIWLDENGNGIKKYANNIPIKIIQKDIAETLSGKVMREALEIK